MEYLVISRGGDQPDVQIMSKEELESLLLEEWRDYTFLNTVPDLEYMGENEVFIFRGEKVNPRPVSQVTKWEV
jgi:hypothetical protein